MTDTYYTCAMCKGQFVSTIDNDHALLEAEFVGFDMDDLTAVCGSCHHQLVYVSQRLGFMDEYGRLTEAGVAAQRDIDKQQGEEK